MTIENYGYRKITLRHFEEFEDERLVKLLWIVVHGVVEPW